MKELSKKERAAIDKARAVFAEHLAQGVLAVRSANGPLGSFTVEDRQHAFEYVMTRTCGVALGFLLRSMTEATHDEGHTCTPEAHAHLFWQGLYASVAEGWSPDGNEAIPWCEPTCEGPDGDDSDGDAPKGVVH